MSSVPYVFASQTGNIPLSHLDANFSNVKASVDYATTAGSANTATLATTATVAARVTANAQPNITSVGSTFTVTGNVTAGNILLSGISSSTGNTYGGNLIAADTVFGTSFIGSIVSLTGNIVSGNLSTGKVVTSTLVSNVANIAIEIVGTGNIGTTGYISTTGNVTGGNIITAGRVQNTGLAIGAVNYVSVTGNAATTSLSTTISRNILIANNTGYTHTINMPTSPVDGQITNFAVSGNTMTLVVGTGTVTPTFAGSATAGTAYTYIYRDSNTTWYRTN